MSRDREHYAELRAVPIFADLPDHHLEQLAGLAHERAFDAGDVVFNEGDAGIGVFIITEGQFELRHMHPGGESVVEETLGPGDVFGLTSLWDEGLRRSSAYAITDGHCLALTRLTFRDAVLKNPALAFEVMRAMAKRLRDLSALLDRA